MDGRALAALEESVDQLAEFYQNLGGGDFLVYETWTAQDVLRHLVFWHESFARNTHDCALGIKPKPLKGSLSGLNEAGVQENRSFPTADLLRRLAAAQAIIREFIGSPAIALIPYRQGSRPYGPDEHLEVVRRHIEGHLVVLRRAARQAAAAPGQERTPPGRTGTPNTQPPA